MSQQSRMSIHRGGVRQFVVDEFREAGGTPAFIERTLARLLAWPAGVCGVGGRRNASPAREPYGLVGVPQRGEAFVETSRIALESNRTRSGA